MKNVKSFDQFLNENIGFSNYLSDSLIESFLERVFGTSNFRLDESNIIGSGFGKPSKTEMERLFDATIKGTPSNAVWTREYKKAFDETMARDEEMRWPSATTGNLGAHRTIKPTNELAEKIREQVIRTLWDGSFRKEKGWGFTDAEWADIASELYDEVIRQWNWRQTASTPIDTIIANTKNLITGRLTGVSKRALNRREQEEIGGRATDPKGWKSGKETDDDREYGGYDDDSMTSIEIGNPGEWDKPEGYDSETAMSGSDKELVSRSYGMEDEEDEITKSTVLKEIVRIISSDKSITASELANTLKRMFGKDVSGLYTNDEVAAIKANIKELKKYK